MINKGIFDKYCDDYMKNVAARKGKQYLEWECQNNFLKSWDIEALDFATMYDKSLKSNISVRLWKQEEHYPKELMLKFINLDKEFVRSMFRDLYDEDKEIDGRMSRFAFHCESLLEALVKLEPKQDNHYHASHRMPSYYLSFRYPELYAPYQYYSFKAFMEKMGARKIPTTDDMERFFKVMRVCYKFLSQHPDFESVVEVQLEEGVHYKEDSLFWVHDFANYCIGH